MQPGGQSAAHVGAATTTTTTATGASQRRPPISNSKSICAEGERPRPLMHSVSIVVELAQKGACGSSSSPPGTPSYCSYSCSTSGGSSSTTASGASSSGCESSALAEAERRRLEKLVTGMGGGRAASSSGKSVESDEENERSDDKSEEEEEEEEDCCLSSSLARRVVLVDEADKIFMRNRAQSADPHCAPAYLAELARPGTPQGGSGAVRSPPPAPIHSADLSSQSIIQQRRLSRRARHSVASATISPTAIGATGNWRSTGPASGRAHGGSPLAAGGSSELAERGELRQLSMRRNTHHQVSLERESPGRQASASFSWQHQPLVMRSSAGSQQLPQTLDTASCQQFNKQLQEQQQQHQPQQQPQQQQQDNHQQLEQHRFLAASTSSTNQRLASASRLPPIQHRRQSLQINLLGSLARDSSRSLTEEELRGEREFNEQLRCAARSPDFFGALKQHQHQHQVFSAGLQQQQQQQLQRHNSQHQPPRCQSTSGCWPALARDSLQPPSGASPTSAPEEAPSQQLLQLQAISPNSASGRRRRVSFGSIDPIVLASTRSPDPQAAGSPFCSPSSLQQAASGKRQRASICNSLLSSQQQLGILRKLAAPQQQQQLAFRMAERESELAQATGLGTEEAAQTNPCPRRIRLASVGEPAAVAAASASARAQDFQPANSTGELATGLKPGATRRHQSKSISSAAGGAPVANDDSRVRSIMANAKLRQEEFARLLEEHEQIVNEINKFETKISTDAAAAAKQQQQQQSGQL